MAIRQPIIKRIDSDVDSKAERAGRGALLGTVGAAGGAAIGSSMGGLMGFACGPAAIICVPIGLAAGAGIGGVGGAIVGVSVGGTGGIAGDKADRFNVIAARLMDEDTLQSKLHDQVSASASRYWVVRDDSANTVGLKINSLQFRQPGRETVQLVVSAEVETEFDGQEETIKVKQLSTQHHIDYWLNGNGENFQTEIDVAIESIARGLVDRLVDPDRVAGHETLPARKHSMGS